jgi:hypothetical protein
MSALSPDDETTGAELAPRRMLDGGAGEHERNWLASARLDRVPSGAKARVAAALGGVLEPQPAPGELEPAVRGAAPPASARWGLGVVAASVVGALALSLGLLATPGESSTAVASIPGASTTTPSSLPSPAVESPQADSPAAPQPQAQLAQQKVPSRSDRSEPPRPKKKSVAAHAEPTGSGLLAEVRALEAVSAAIGAAQLDRAARELDAYRRRFGRGELAIEADVLAIQIAAARGDDAAASAGAERLLARPEAEHYRARVHALLGSEVPSSSSPNRDSSSPNHEKAERGRSNEPGAHMRARR